MTAAIGLDLAQGRGLRGGDVAGLILYVDGGILAYIGNQPG